MTLAVAGAGSTIAQVFLQVVANEGREVVPVQTAKLNHLPDDCDRYLICTGYLAGKAIGEQDYVELMDTFEFNFAAIAQFCDKVLERNPKVRICIIGSHSGEEGSFDMAYAGAKAAMHLYIRKRALKHPDQMLVGLAPHIVCDAGMTLRRPDLAATLERGEKTRLGRWITAFEVAAMAHDVLYRWPACTSGQVVSMRAS